MTLIQDTAFRLRCDICGRETWPGRGRVDIARDVAHDEGWTTSAEPGSTPVDLCPSCSSDRRGPRPVASGCPTGVSPVPVGQSAPLDVELAAASAAVAAYARAHPVAPPADPQPAVEAGAPVPAPTRTGAPSPPTDLMAALEKSLAAAKAARARRQGPPTP